MESFDLKNVWNALTTMERETIIDAAKDSQGVSWGHYSSVVKGILLSASSAGRVDLSYRDPLFWNAADVLREQGIAEAALRQQEIPKLTVQLLAPILHTLCENKTVAQVYDERLLSIHGIYAIVLEPENAFAFDPLLQIKKQERQVEADEVEWVVNNYFEVGVKIRGRSFFLYKGRSLEYTEEKITTRPLGKRELGEVLRVNGEDQ